MSVFSHFFFFFFFAKNGGKIRVGCVIRSYQFQIIAFFNHFDGVEAETRKSQKQSFIMCHAKTSQLAQIVRSYNCTSTTWGQFHQTDFVV